MKKYLKYFLNKIGYSIHKRNKMLNPYTNLSSWDYQKTLVERHIKNTDIVLDIGSGNFPSPRANILVEAFPDESIHRSGNLVEDRPVVICSVERMPFLQKSFDFSICSHVLEHIESPLRAKSELSRISMGGYIETPSYGKDILVGTGNMHRWQVVEFEKVLYFFEYSPRQTEAHTHSPMMDIWMSQDYHPWQDFFWDRQDLFNAILIWKDHIELVEYRRYGSKENPLVDWKPVPKNRLPMISCQLNEKEIEILQLRLSTPDSLRSMKFINDSFIDETGSIIYPVRGKRVYCELIECSINQS